MEVTCLNIFNEKLCAATKIQISSFTWCLSNMGQTRDFLRKLSIAWRNGCSPVVLQHINVKRTRWYFFYIGRSKQPPKSFVYEMFFFKTRGCFLRSVEMSTTRLQNHKMSSLVSAKCHQPIFSTSGWIYNFLFWLHTKKSHSRDLRLRWKQHRLVQQLDPFVKRDPQNLKVFVEISIDANFKALVAQTKAHQVLSIWRQQNFTRIDPGDNLSMRIPREVNRGLEVTTTYSPKKPNSKMIRPNQPTSSYVPIKEKRRCTILTLATIVLSKLVVWLSRSRHLRRLVFGGKAHFTSHQTLEIACSRHPLQALISKSEKADRCVT